MSIVGTKIPRDEIAQFMRVAEFVLARIRPFLPKRNEDVGDELARLVHKGVHEHLKTWELEKVEFCWLLMLQLRMKKVPISYIDYVVVLPENKVEVHFLESKIAR